MTRTKFQRGLKPAILAGWVLALLAAFAAAGTGHPELDRAYAENRWPDALREVGQIQADAPQDYAAGRYYLLHAWLLEQLGRPAEAAAVYAAWQDKDALFRDYILWSRAQALVAAGVDAGARQCLYELVRALPDSPWAPEAHFQLAASYADAGKLDLAQQTFESYILKQKKRRQEARLRVARIHLARQDWAAAGALLQELLRCGESRTEAAAAVAIADQPELLSAARASELRLAALVRVLIENREVTRAQPLAAELQQRFPASAGQPLYQYWRGRCFFLKGDYPSALTWFQQAAGGGDKGIATQSRFAMARAFTLAGREAEAVPIYTALLAEADTDRGRADVLRALYNIARLTGPSDAALGWLDQGVRTLRGVSRLEFSFRLALLDLQLGLPQQAAPALAELAAKLPPAADGDRPDRSEATFFLGLTHAAAGDDAQALEVWTSDVYRWGNYYSFLSMDRARRILAQQPPLGERLAAAARQRFAESAAAGDETAAYRELCRLHFLTGDLDAWRQGVARLPKLSARLAELAAVAPLPDGELPVPAKPSLKSAATILYRARTFQRLGLAAPAALEYDRCRLADIAKADGSAPADLAACRLYTQARLFARSGSIHRAFTYAHGLLRRYPAGTPFAAIHPEVMGWCYPAPFRDDVLTACREAVVEPYLVYGIMLQESRCNPRAHSPVAARGLMQLMPETAKEVAARRNIPLSSDPAALYGEGLNVRLGVWYVRQLLDSLQHAAPVAAAYNAGQSQAMYWSRLSGKPLDYYFIPEVHFNQTREYVNLVLANRSMYAWLYPDLAAAAPPPANGASAGR